MINKLSILLLLNVIVAQETIANSFLTEDEEQASKAMTEYNQLIMDTPKELLYQAIKQCAQESTYELADNAVQVPFFALPSWLACVKKHTVQKENL